MQITTIPKHTPAHELKEDDASFGQSFAQILDDIDVTDRCADAEVGIAMKFFFETEVLPEDFARVTLSLNRLEARINQLSGESFLRDHIRDIRNAQLWIDDQRLRKQGRVLV